jgi:DNA repair photolyase
MRLTEVAVRGILTRTSGFLETVSSHSLQPYRGCSFGRSLCGVGCYVQHNPFLVRGQPWGGFLEARVNAAEVYRRQYLRERAWARCNRSAFGIFMSSSTDPFVPHEDRFHISRQLLEQMLELPPDQLIIQTHTHRVLRYLDLYRELGNRTELRFHISIESDRERLPGLPPPASPVARRFEAARRLKREGLRVVIAVAPLLPLADPREFFRRVAAAADAVVVDHFIGGDGTPDGRRTRRTALPEAMAALQPESTSLAYRDAVVSVAREVMPGRVGVSIDGFAGRFAEVAAPL